MSHRIARFHARRRAAPRRAGIEACIEAGELVAEGPFEVQGDARTPWELMRPRLGLPRRSREEGEVRSPGRRLRRHPLSCARHARSWRGCSAGCTWWS